MLKGKHILLGITGSIAAYKAAILVRALVKQGAEVKVIMTPMAKEFISPLTIATLAKNPILVDFYNPENGDWNSHISLGMWADAYVIAPASANTIAKMAYGIADNLLLTTYLSSRAPVVVAPAMDVDMFLHSTTQDNIERLRKLGVSIVEPASGELASGLDGKGRMEEPEIIVQEIDAILSDKTLKGRRVMITAGPTVEEIDPVRYISNHSSGKMGYSLAYEMYKRGAQVTLVSGPVNIPAPSGISLHKVKSALDMLNASNELYKEGQDIAIFCAAVADYRVDACSETKLKRGDSTFALNLIPNPDIAFELGMAKKEGAIHIGFALETDNEESNAVAKMGKKNLDAIVLNSLKDKGAGFASDTNKITILGKKGDVIPFDLKLKDEVAKDIVDYIESLL